ncbi:hypothetical protein EON82_00865 [bacterium]|nr:MAG: hypothetical protein EON82_00865 [bacterium]
MGREEEALEKLTEADFASMFDKPVGAVNAVGFRNEGGARMGARVGSIRDFMLLDLRSPVERGSAAPLEPGLYYYSFWGLRKLERRGNDK